MQFTCCAPFPWYFLWYLAKHDQTCTRNQSALSEAWKLYQRYVLWCGERKERTRMQLWGALVWSLLMGKIRMRLLFLFDECDWKLLDSQVLFDSKLTRFDRDFTKNHGGPYTKEIHMGKCHRVGDTQILATTWENKFHSTDIQLITWRHTMVQLIWLIKSEHVRTYFC